MGQYIHSQKTVNAPKLTKVVICKMIIQGAGVPRLIVTDQRSLFTSDYWLVLANYLGFKRNLTAIFDL